MELEMYLDGRFIDAISISSSQLGKIHELQHQMEKRYCHELEYSNGQLQFFISGSPSGMDAQERKKLKQGLGNEQWQ